MTPSISNQLNNLQNSVAVFWGETSTPNIRLIKKKKKASEERLSNKPDEGLKASVWHQYDEIRSRLSFPGCDHQIHGGGGVCFAWNNIWVAFMGHGASAWTPLPGIFNWNTVLWPRSITFTVIRSAVPLVSWLISVLIPCKWGRKHARAPAVLVFNDHRSKICPQKTNGCAGSGLFLPPFKRDPSPQKHPPCHFLYRQNTGSMAEVTKGFREHLSTKCRWTLKVRKQV